MSAPSFQEQYDDIRDKAGKLFKRNPGAYSQLSKYGKMSIRIKRLAELAGTPVTVRPRGWTKEQEETA